MKPWVLLPCFALCLATLSACQKPAETLQVSSQGTSVSTASAETLPDAEQWRRELQQQLQALSETADSFVLSYHSPNPREDWSCKDPVLAKKWIAWLQKIEFSDSYSEIFLGTSHSVAFAPDAASIFTIKPNAFQWNKYPQMQFQMTNFKELRSEFQELAIASGCPAEHFE